MAGIWNADVFGEDREVFSFVPMSKEYAEITPFQFASDNPISNIDLEGLDEEHANKG